MSMDEQPEQSELLMLDEPAAPAKKPRLRVELLLGLAILIGIVGWGALDWWNSQRGVAYYQQARAAASHSDWDTALEYYRRAGSYSDAPAQAENTARLVAERDGYYQTAVQSADKADWLAALIALQNLDGIQPNYRDAAARETDARSALLTDAFTNTIALRTTADPPGLYLYGGGGWQWLTGSDTTSKLRGGDNCEYIVYDVPAQGSSTRPRATPFDSGDRLPPGRSLVAARLTNGKLEAHQLAIGAPDFNGYTCTHSGLIAYYEDAASTNEDLDHTLAFEPFTSPLTKTLQLPAGSLLWGLSTERDQLILQQRTSTSANSDATAILSLDISSGSTKLLTTLPDQPVLVAVSSDYTKVLLEMKASLDLGHDEYTIYYVDLAAGASKKLTDWVVDLHTSTGRELFAQIVSGGPFDGKILFNKILDSGSSAWLVDSQNASDVLWRSPEQTGKQYVYPLATKDGLLINWAPLKCGEQTRSMVYLNSALETKGIELNLPEGQMIEQISEHDGRMIYITTSRCWGSSVGYTIFVTQPSLLQGQSGAGAELHSGESDRTLGRLNRGWNLGTKVAAYLQDEELHVADYAGQYDLVLEKGVKIFYGSHTRGDPGE